VSLFTVAHLMAHTHLDGSHVVSLACIAHKSLEIFKRMQAVAAEFSGYAGQFCCFFGKNNFKQFVLIHLF
jgi:hypothetical protein